MPAGWNFDGQVQRVEIRRRVVVGAGDGQPAHRRHQRHELPVEQRRLFAKQRHRAAEERFRHGVHRAVQVAEALVRHAGCVNGDDRARVCRQRLNRRHVQQALVVGVPCLHAVHMHGFHRHAGVQAEPQHFHCDIRGRSQGHLDANVQTPPRFDGHLPGNALDVEAWRRAQGAVGLRPSGPFRLRRARLPRQPRNCGRTRSQQDAAKQQPFAAWHLVQARPNTRGHHHQPGAENHRRNTGGQIRSGRPARQDFRARQAQIGDAGQRRQQVERRIEDREKAEPKQRQGNARGRPTRA